MMTPLRFPFTFQPPNLTYGTGSPMQGAMCRGPLIVHRVTAEQNHSPSDC